MKKLLGLSFFLLFIFSSLIFACTQVQAKKFTHFENSKKIGGISKPPIVIPLKVALKLYQGQLKEYQLPGYTLRNIFPFPTKVITRVTFKKGWKEKKIIVKDYDFFQVGIILPLLILGIFTFALCHICYKDKRGKMNKRNLLSFFIALEMFPIVGMFLIILVRYLGGNEKIIIPIMIGLIILGSVSSNNIVEDIVNPDNKSLLTELTGSVIAALGGLTVAAFAMGIALVVDNDIMNINTIFQYIYFMLGSGIISFFAVVIISQWRKGIAENKKN